MDAETPVKVPGAKLAAQRDAYGVTRKDLAGRMKLHRNTLRAWEMAPEVSVIRQRRYLAALRALVEEQSPGHAA